MHVCPKIQFHNNIFSCYNSLWFQFFLSSRCQLIKLKTMRGISYCQHENAFILLRLNRNTSRTHRTHTQKVNCFCVDHYNNCNLFYYGWEQNKIHPVSWEWNGFSSFLLNVCSHYSRLPWHCSRRPFWQYAMRKLFAKMQCEKFIDKFLSFFFISFKFVKLSVFSKRWKANM